MGGHVERDKDLLDLCAVQVDRVGVMDVLENVILRIDVGGFPRYVPSMYFW